MGTNKERGIKNRRSKPFDRYAVFCRRSNCWSRMNVQAPNIPTSASYFRQNGPSSPLCSEQPSIKYTYINHSQIGALIDLVKLNINAPWSDTTQERHIMYYVAACGCNGLGISLININQDVWSLRQECYSKSVGSDGHWLFSGPRSAPPRDSLLRLSIFNVAAHSGVSNRKAPAISAFRDASDLLCCSFRPRHKASFRIHFLKAQIWFCFFMSHIVQSVPNQDYSKYIERNSRRCTCVGWPSSPQEAIYTS